MTLSARSARRDAEPSGGLPGRTFGFINGDDAAADLIADNDLFLKLGREQRLNGARRAEHQVFAGYTVQGRSSSRPSAMSVSS